MFLSTSHPIALSRRARSRPACSASAQFGVNGLSGPCGLTILASAWLVLNATSNLLASSCAACSSWCMFLLPSEYSSPPRPPCVLLRGSFARPLLDRLGSLAVSLVGSARRFEGRDTLDESSDDPARLGVGLALGGQLLAQNGDQL